MKTFKIILGFLLLYGAGKEYVNSGRELGTFFSGPAIFVMVLFLFLSTWLIGSGFSEQRFKFKSFGFVKFFIISFVSLLFFILVSKASYKVPEVYVEYNGIKLSVGKCIEGNRRLIPDKEERKKYCFCMAEKLANSERISTNYRKELETGEFDKIFIENQNEYFFEELSIENCSDSIEMKWTDNFANSMKIVWKKELEGTEFENTHDIDKYCDFKLKEYRKFPLKDIMSESFLKSEQAISIEAKCYNISKK